ncbi:MAG: isoprenylcysteine carboxylmethyltransferase family protein [Acidobacteriota bacterium]
MTVPAYLLLLLNFGFIGLLPRIFFRHDGRLTLMWWVTALPLFLIPISVTLLFIGVVEPVVAYSTTAGHWLQVTFVPFAVSSIALIGLTIGSNRVPLSLWHQEDDAPGHIVTWGAYRRIRHPFYCAFLLAAAGAVVLAPHPLTLLGFIYSVFVLNHTAAREEKRLAESEFGAEYQDYMRHTGRFLPSMRRWRDRD